MFEIKDKSARQSLEILEWRVSHIIEIQLSQGSDIDSIKTGLEDIVKQLQEIRQHIGIERLHLPEQFHLRKIPSER